MTKFISNNSDPPIAIRMKDLTYDGKPLKIIEVPEGSNKPYIIKENGIFIRRNGITEQITRVELEDIMQRRIGGLSAIA